MVTLIKKKLIIIIDSRKPLAGEEVILHSSGTWARHCAGELGRQINKRKNLPHIESGRDVTVKARTRNL